MNIEIGIIALAVLATGYWVFVGKQGAVFNRDGATTNINIAEQTIAEGSDLAHTIEILRDLNNTVLASAGIFKMPAFRELRDFSVKIPKEPQGRDNPFAQTEWKIKLGK